MAFNGGTTRNNPDFFIKNKAYFDHNLIALLSTQKAKIASLNDEIAIYKSNTYILTKKNFDLQFQLKQASILNHNYRMKLKHLNEEIDIRDELQNELDEMKKELDETLEELRKENQRQYEELQRLRNENNRLKRKGKLTSANSSIPSSQQGFREVKNSRKKTGRKVGGQTGHAFHKSVLKEKADIVVEKAVTCIPTGAKAVAYKGTVLYYVTQEIDINIQNKVIETRYYLDKDGEDLSKEVMNTYKINPVSYSNHYKAVVLYLNNKGILPYHRFSQILKELSNGEISLQASTIAMWVRSFHVLSKTVREEMITRIIADEIVHVDETGWKIDGNKEWVQVMASSKLVLYLMVHQRGKDKEGVLPILKEYKGALVHDHFTPYYQILECIHVECNAHVLRYLQQGIDLDQSKGCQKMKVLLEEMLHEKKEYQEQNRHHFEAEKIAGYQKRYREILEEELERYAKENPNISKKCEADYIKLFRRLKEYEVAHLQFICNFSMPFTNNHAERLIRGIKIHKKIAGQSKTKEGAKATASLTSIVQSCGLQGYSSIEAIEAILNKEAVKFLS